MVAENGPASVIDAGQIGSTDAVSVGRGFARLSGADWDSLFEYFEVALDVRVGAWVWDAGTLDRSQRVFGLASYLLVSGLGSSYAVIPGGFEGLYQLDPGLPTSQPWTTPAFGRGSSRRARWPSTPAWWTASSAFPAPAT